MNGGILASWINVSDTRMVEHRRFIHFLVYALVYLSIASNLVTLSILITWYDSL